MGCTMKVLHFLVLLSVTILHCFGLQARVRLPWSLVPGTSVALPSHEAAIEDPLVDVPLNPVPLPDQDEAPVSRCMFCTEAFVEGHLKVAFECGDSAHKNCLVNFFLEHIHETSQFFATFNFACHHHEEPYDLFIDLCTALEIDSPEIFFVLLASSGDGMAASELLNLHFPDDPKPYWLKIIESKARAILSFITSNNIPFLHYVYEGRTPVEWAEHLGPQDYYLALHNLQAAGRCLPAPSLSLGLVIGGYSGLYGAISPVSSDDALSIHSLDSNV